MRKTNCCVFKSPLLNQQKLDLFCTIKLIEEKMPDPQYSHLLIIEKGVCSYNL